MHKALTVLSAAILASTCIAASINRKELRHNVAGKQAVAKSVARAGAGTVINTPHQWGRGPEGFAKRAGSSLAKNAIKQTIQAGVGSALHEDLHYHPSHLHGTLPRVKYAVKSTFVVPRTNRRGTTVATGRIAGNVGAGMISQAWMPAASVAAGVGSAGIGLGADVGVNVAREFWPRHPKRKPR